MATFGTVSTIKPPKLTDVYQSNPFKFEIEYAQYKMNISQIIEEQSEEREIPVASIRQCIDPEILNSLCIIGLIENASSLEDATVENVKKWFDKRLEEAPEDLTENVNTSLATVDYRCNKNDPSGAAMSFIVKMRNKPIKYLRNWEIKGM